MSSTREGTIARQCIEQARLGDLIITDYKEFDDIITELLLYCQGKEMQFRIAFSYLIRNCTIDIKNV